MSDSGSAPCTRVQDTRGVYRIKGIRVLPGGGGRGAHYAKLTPTLLVQTVLAHFRLDCLWLNSTCAPVRVEMILVVTIMMILTMMMMMTMTMTLTMILKMMILLILTLLTFSIVVQVQRHAGCWNHGSKYMWTSTLVPFVLDLFDICSFLLKCV